MEITANKNERDFKFFNLIILATDVIWIGVLDVNLQIMVSEFH